MSKADKMFSDLGYKKLELTGYIEYIKRADKLNEEYCISFLEADKSFMATIYSGVISSKLAVRPEELIAIVEKEKELGWI